MGFQFSNSIKRGGASCCEVINMGCELKTTLRMIPSVFKALRRVTIGKGGRGRSCNEGGE